MPKRVTYLRDDLLIHSILPDEETVNEDGDPMSSPLGVAMNNGNYEIIRYLMSHGISVGNAAAPDSPSYDILASKVLARLK